MRVLRSAHGDEVDILRRPPRLDPERDERPLDMARVREAVRAVVAAPGLDVAPLLAWLRAWQHHWGGSFRATFGAEGDEIVEGLRPRLHDENRCLKLRRIAIENLAGVL